MSLNTIQRWCVYVSATIVRTDVLAPSPQTGSDLHYNLSDRQADREKHRQLLSPTPRHLTKAFSHKLWTLQSN